MDIQNLVNKKVTIFFASEGQRFKYEGILKSVDSAMLIIDDIKDGIVALPIQSCQIKAGDLNDRS